MHPVIGNFIEYLTHELNRSSLTVEAYHRDLLQFSDWLTGSHTDGLEITDITLADIRAWLAGLSRSGESPITIRRKAQSLRAFFRYLVKRRIITVNPTADLVLPKIPKKLPDTLRPEDVEQALNHLHTESSCEQDSGNWRDLFDMVVLETLYTLGIRRAELIAINDSDVWTDVGEIKIFGKRSKIRVVPVSQELLSLIRKWQQLRDSLWERENGETALFAVKGKRVTASQVYGSVKRSLSGVTASRKSPHALRHSFATGMLNEGAELNSVKEFLGHSSLATTQIYTHVSFAEMKKAYRNAHPRAVGRKVADDHEVDDE